MRRLTTMILGLAGLLAWCSTALAKDRAAEDVIVWKRTDAGYRSVWMRVEGGKATELGSRDEAVISDGTRLWAARLTTRSVDLYSCEAMENDDTNAKPEGRYEWPLLDLVEITGTDHKPAKVVEGDQAEGSFYGEVWSESIRLTGSVGSMLMVEHINTGYACGAHGYDDSNMFVWDAATGGGVDTTTLVKGEKTWREPHVEALLEQVKTEQCYESDLSDESVFLDGFELQAVGDELDLDAVYVHPTGASWQFACTISENVTVPLAQRAPSVTPSQAVMLALKPFRNVGTVGYAVVRLTGEARTRALEAFQKTALPKAKRNVAKADAAPFINSGRKLTREKKYDAAIAAFDTAIRKDPKAARAWSGRGFAKLQAGKLDAAARDFDHALTLDATEAYHAAVWFNLGQIAEQQKKLRQAQRAYTRSNKLKPSKAVKKALDRVKKVLK